MLSIGIIEECITIITEQIQWHTCIAAVEGIVTGVDFLWRIDVMLGLH